MSTRNSAASFASSSFSAFAAARTASRYADSLALFSPRPTSSTRSAATPGSARRSSVEPVLPERSRSAFLSAPLEAWSSRRAAGGELIRLMDTDHDAAGLRRLGRERLYAKFHGAKVSHDLPAGAAQRVRRSCRRGVHDAVRDRGHHAAYPPARPGGGRQVSFGCGVRLPRLLRARRAAGAAVAHHVHLGAAHHDAQLARLRDGDLVQRRAAAHRLAQAGAALRAAADRGDRALSLFISPWAAQMAAQYASRIDTRDDVSRVTPGVFGETANRSRVFFVESVSGDSSAVQNVFVSSTHQNKQRRQHEPHRAHRDRGQRRPLPRARATAGATRARPATPSTASPSSTATPRASS